MQLKRSELIYRMNSKNWADYQVVIESLKLDYASIMRDIGWHYYQIHQELTARNLDKDGWGLHTVTPIYDKENKFQLAVVVRKADGYSLKPIYSDEDVGYGLGTSIPEHMRKYEYKEETLIVPSKFINEYDMRKAK